MTRKEYIAALDQYLVTMSASEKADILSDYEEHFRVGLENGKTESQIAASLGSPYDVASQFLEGEKPKVPQYPQRASSAAPQGYTAQPRPTQAPQGYANQSRPTQAPQGYSNQPRPTQAPQGYTSQQLNRTREVYETGIQDYTQTGYPQRQYQDDGYEDYDSQSAQQQYSSNTAQSGGYSTTGIVLLVVLCVLLIPTVGSTLVSLLLGLYGSVIGFAAAGGSLIAVGAAFSAQSLWVCVGLVFIGISFIALTGLLVMGSIEGTKLFIKLIKYCIKEGKKLVTEGSF